MCEMYYITAYHAIYSHFFWVVSLRIAKLHPFMRSKVAPAGVYGKFNKDTTRYKTLNTENEGKGSINMIRFNPLVHSVLILLF